MEGESKNKVKQALMSKLKGMSNVNPRPEMQEPIIKSQMQMPMQSQQQQMQQAPMRVDTQQDFRKMPYQGKAKYDNQLKALNALKNQTQQRSQRPKKMFFEHYDTQQPYCPVIQNNSNPSGRPPNIPAQMYEGITVKPKRPWVYLGNQNLPPVQYQQINQSSFKNIAKKNIEAKEQLKRKPGQNPNNAMGPKPRKKPEKQEVNKQQSQFDMSDEIVDEGQSIFASQYNTETINKPSQNKKSRLSSIKNSYVPQDYSASEGTQTRKKQAEIFGSDQGDMSYDDDESGMFSKSKSKNTNQNKSKKQMMKRKKDDYSDDEDDDEE